MKWLLLFCLFSIALEAARNPSPYDATELLLKVRQKVMVTVESLPSYLCTETVDRATFQPTVALTNRSASQKPQSSEASNLSCDYLARLRDKPGWQTRKSQSDRIAFDVAVSREGEMYSLLGENRFRADAPAGLFGSGVTSTGAFGIFLNTIFASDAASFTYQGDTSFQGRTLAQFSYRVPLEKGGYSIKTKVNDQEHHGDRKYSAVVPYDGTFLVDPQTFDLVRLTVHAGQLPQELKICETATTLDYAYVRMNHSEFLLPTSARLHINNDDGSESENNMTFSACHEFGSESTLRFDAPAAGQPGVSVRHDAEPPGLSAAQQEQLLAIRKNIMATLDRLPKYLCTETIDRSTFLPKAAVTHRSCDGLANGRKKSGWKVHESQSDRLRLDVAVSQNENEMYSWVGENRFHDRSLADLVGSGVTSTGAFGALLSSIFGGNTANFSYNGRKEFNGRALVEFGFRVPFDKSGFSVGNRTYSAIVPYAGVFLADPKSFDIVRLVVDVDQLPEQLHACDDTTTLDYASVLLNDAQFLLPRRALLRIVNDDRSEFENRTAFSGCHEFLGESKLRFDTP
ncbi:MAG TPA: hypothetical protein VHZ55_29270, partial [Bryobacteraceae bacterium]|nr:hypothetical protein [Bryobacteraceae bacterium]